MKRIVLIQPDGFTKEERRSLEGEIAVVAKMFDAEIIVVPRGLESLTKTEMKAISKKMKEAIDNG